MSQAGPDLYYEDVVVGTEMSSAPHTLTAADIAAFCDLTHDHHPLHTDADYARTRGYSGVIAHGLYGLALMEGLKTAMGLYENSSIASLGWEKVRFVRPVVAGDTVHVTFTFTDKRLSSKGGRGVITEDLRLVNQRGETVIEAQHAALVLTRHDTCKE
ncbi:monoamine oxidase [Azorhizobium oxalatiphilum]|uniref:Monoamine oxidase n=1 Tax=Azorhizobium oxalatiphilum TaxID=980631 RepID=A0A917C3A9_9HYPH|nr:MaoC/PaaZ C-terminal domain-containing protein [Azorhizobium oxalatiphilum]GGF70245.1 monoamine oxidase [Azorhizobium oxalatiphilum]